MARLFSTLLALGMLATGLSAQGNLAGSWELSINGPEGVITATADLKQDGEKITGSIASPQGTVDLTGTANGKTVNLSFTIPGPSGNLDIKVTGEVEGADMKGMIDFGLGMADFTAKKK